MNIVTCLVKKKVKTISDTIHIIWYFTFENKLVEASVELSFMLPAIDLYQI
jgi:hypothetical protein